MASTASYTVKAYDSLWAIAASYLTQSGFTDVPTLVTAIINYNVGIVDPQALPIGLKIVVPFSTS